ncbi:hypothetical protein MSHI_33480 [Mycobacterium shinjukuense]|uniref:Uncharacterized protein n=1 Tax=Mycobacterium shinjukuense TaxID=398694 RepID=A0A7I7MUB5_9MYCO|nr:hypothetical protein MSHI_33480 [Mycobacterium shinjukuense]
MSTADFGRSDSGKLSRTIYADDRSALPVGRHPTVTPIPAAEHDMPPKSGATCDITKPPIDIEEADAV